MTRTIKLPAGPRGIRSDSGINYSGLRSEESSAEEKSKTGLDALRHEYYAEVRSLAEDVQAQVKAGQLKDSEAVTEYLYETIDGHQWVIYTWRSQMVVLVSDNSDALVDSQGAEGLVKDGNINWGAIAYYALEQDVLECLGDIDELFEESAE